MTARSSALHGHTDPRRHGLITDAPGLTLTEAPIASLWQFSAWPQTLAEVGAVAAAAAGLAAAPGPGRAGFGARGTLLRTEPMKWQWLAEEAVPAPVLAPELGTVLDLGHARTRVHVAGPAAADLMARLVPLDLRPARAPEGTVASSLMHHLGVTVLVRAGGYDLMVIRGFGLALWEHVLEVGAQFGVEIV